MSTFYVDSKMAWCTVAGGFVANFLLGGLAKSYGLIMEAYQEVFQSGSAYLQLAGGMIYTLMYCLSLVNHYVSERYGSRPVVLVGAVGCCISLLIAAYSQSIALWVFAIGVGVGASLACIYFTVFSVVGRCFRRYLGIANGISVAGVSVGQIAFPSMITYLNETYGTRGSTVIMAAVCLHLLITAVLMPRYIVDPEAPAAPVTKADPPDEERRRRRRRRWMIRRKCDRQSTGDDMKLTANSTMISMDDASVLKQLDAKPDTLYTEVINDLSENKLPPSLPDMLLKQRSCSKLSLKKVRQLSESRLSKALLAIYICGKIFADIGDVSISFVAPMHGSKMGFSPVMVSRAIAVAGAVDLVSRLGVGWLTDQPGCVGKRGLLMASIWLLTGFNSLMFAELHRLAPDEGGPSRALTVCYFICFGIHGVCSGTAMTQMIVVLSDWVGTARIAHSLAMTMVVLGIVIAPGQFLIGYLADTTNSYVWPLRVCCIMMLLAGLILLLEFPIRYIHGKRLRVSVEAWDRQNAAISADYRPHPETHDPSSSAVWLVDHSDDSDDADERAQSPVLSLTRFQPGVGPVPALYPTLSNNNLAADCRPTPPTLFIASQSHTNDDWGETPICV